MRESEVLSLPGSFCSRSCSLSEAYPTRKIWGCPGRSGREPSGLNWLEERRLVPEGVFCDSPVIAGTPRRTVSSVATSEASPPPRG